MFILYLMARRDFVWLWCRNCVFSSGLVNNMYLGDSKLLIVTVSKSMCQYCGWYSLSSRTAPHHAYLDPQYFWGISGVVHEFSRYDIMAKNYQPRTLKLKRFFCISSKYTLLPSHSLLSLHWLLLLLTLSSLLILMNHYSAV